MIDMAEQNISRRALVGAGVVGAATLLAGCAAPSTTTATTPSENTQTESSADTAVNFDYKNNYLPLGSIVLLDGYAEHIAFMIVARRPRVDSEDGMVPDYAGVFYPFGFMTFASEDAEMAGSQAMAFNTEDITAVVYLGFSNAIEEEAELELASGRNTTKNCQELLLPLADSLFNAEELLSHATIEEEDIEEVLEDDAS